MLKLFFSKKETKVREEKREPRVSHTVMPPERLHFNEVFRSYNAGTGILAMQSERVHLN